MADAFDIARFHSLLKTRAFGRNLIFEASTGSTMDLAREAAAHGAVEGTVALADEQTAGRGRLGRSWVTPPTLNLASTVIVRPPATVLRTIAMMTPLAICDSLAEVCGIRAGIKWPNDVQVEGKKLAGVLIESDLSRADVPTVLVGAGINVNFDPGEHEELRDIATSVRVATGRDGDREHLLASYLMHFERFYDATLAGVSPHGAWRERLVTIGQQVHASWLGGQTDGIAEDVDAEGALLVRTASGALVPVEAGDVTLRT